jgi:uncharacterized protein
MHETIHGPNPITRRQLIGRTAGVAAGAASVLAAPAAASAKGAGRQRVAIIGAGAGGITAGYLVGGVHDVEIFESRRKIGGHCDTHEIEYKGSRLTVDLGAQFFHPKTHPVYVTLLEQVGLYDPAHPDSDDTLVADASLCVFPAGGGAPAFSSPNALATPAFAEEFAKFTQLARHAVQSNMPWETTVATWLKHLALTPAFKQRVIGPWITALIGSTHADVQRASARSILQTFALSFPEDVTQPFTTYNSTIGLQGNLQRILDRSRSVRVHLGAPVRALKQTASGWYIEMPGGRHGPFHSVVLNAPASTGHQLLRHVPGCAEVAGLLGQYSYFNARLLIHTDPTYMDSETSNWSSYNAETNGPQCEGSVWYGGLDPALPSGPIDVFKSWATHRRSQPAQILLERTFRHPIIDRAALRAAKSLRSHQGRKGLHFSGQYTLGFDAQESAVYSAIRVAESLAPSSRTLSSLTSRLRARGLGHVSYEL